MVGQQPLKLSIGVRVPVPEHNTNAIVVRVPIQIGTAPTRFFDKYHKNNP